MVSTKQILSKHLVLVTASLEEESFNTQTSLTLVLEVRIKQLCYLYLFCNLRFLWVSSVFYSSLDVYAKK